MPTAPPRYCRCGALVTGRCTACTKQQDQQRGHSTARGYGKRWQKARLLFLANDGTGRPRCCVDPYKRHPGRYVLATVVDHVIPHRGDTERFWDVGNLQALCVSCHSAKTALEDGGFGRTRKN